MKLSKFILNRIEDARGGKDELAVRNEDYIFDQGSNLSLELDQDVKSLKRFYAPKKGRLSSWWNRKKSESRTRFLKSLNLEQREIITQARMLEEAVLEGRKKQAEFNIFLAQNAALLLQLKAEIKLTEQATEKGLFKEDYSAVNR